MSAVALQYQQTSGALRTPTLALTTSRTFSEKERTMAARSISPGDVFGRWTVLAAGKLGRGRTWHCRCVCGVERQVRDSCLKRGSSTSCGCYHREQSRRLILLTPITVRTHGRSRTPEYETWHQMLGRCTNPRHHSYKDYGGRGITVCPEWREDFSAFYAHVGDRPSPGHSLDRYPDNDGPYAPGNVRWATITEQMRNRRTTRRLTARGLTLSLSEWAERLGLPYYLLEHRQAAGWSAERVLSPMRPRASRYRGVTWDRNRWKASLTIDGRGIYIGRFLDEDEAARAVSLFRMRKKAEP